MPEPKPKVLLIGWDAADWKVIHPLMDAGKMPALRRMVEQGSMANLATLHPVLSPMLWTSIATGKRPFKHGIHGFSEPSPDGRGIQPITNLSRKTKAVWNILSQNGLRSNVIGWWPSHPAEPICGVMVSNHFQTAVGPPDEEWPVPRRAVHPPELTDTLAQLRLNPNELLAEHILPFIPRAAEIDQEQDRRLASCAKIIAECTSVHAVATWLMQNTEWDFTAVYYDAIDHFCHGFMRFHPPRQDNVPERDFDLYRGVIEAGYRYHDMMLNTLLQLAGPDTTVLLISDHGFHPDHLRPKVLPAEPAGPALEHRDFGIFVAKGPGIHQDKLLHGLGLLDVAPTILSIFGLPPGNDMDGQTVTDAFVEPPEPKPVPSWDKVEGESGMHPPDFAVDPAEAQQALQQLVDLGYIEAPGADLQLAIRKTSRELRYNLARSYMDANHHGMAAEILEELYADWPNEHRFGVQLAMCYQALDRIADLRSVVEDLSTRRKADAEDAREELQKFVEMIRQRRQEEASDSTAALPSGDEEDLAAVDEELAQAEEKLNEIQGESKDDPKQNRPVLSREERSRYRDLISRAHYNPHAIDYLWGYVNLAEGHYGEALECLKRAEEVDAQRPGLHLQIGETYIRLRQADDAMRSFEKAAAIDPENPHAQLGICRSQLLRKKNRPAAEAALKTIGLLYHYPLAHYCLGVALHRLGRLQPAVKALHTAVDMNPNFAEAHQRLAMIYRRRLGEPEKADEHRQLALEMRAERRKALSAHRQYQRQKPSSISQETNRSSESTTPAQQNERQTMESIPPQSGSYITVVSGLPRSGTSLVMQMLAAGGLEIVSDDQRQADESNPRGYYEDQRVKSLAKNNSWLGMAQGKAVKIIAQLLPHFAQQYSYRVIFVNRDLKEVIASQQKMLERDGRSGANLGPEQLEKVFATQLKRIKQWLESQSEIEVLHIDHRRLIEQPTNAAKQISSFLDGGMDESAMAATVDPTLYRNRGV